MECIRIDVFLRISIFQFLWCHKLEDWTKRYSSLIAKNGTDSRVIFSMKEVFPVDF